MNKTNIIDMREAKRILHSEMIDGIIQYRRQNILQNSSPNSYMQCYTVVQSLADDGDNDCDILFKYHNDIIKNFIDFSYKEISKKKGTDQLIDTFIKETDNINFLIYYMNRIFTYLDRFFLKSKGKNSLGKTCIGLYKDNLFTNIQQDLFIGLNKLIKDDRNGNFDSRQKIKYILKIIDDLDLEKPKIIKENNKIFWTHENKDDKNGREIADLWFKNKSHDYSFEEETKKYAENKANFDCDHLNASEYINAALKFFEEEETRQKEFINKRYWAKINNINYLYIVGQKAEAVAQKDTGLKYMFENKQSKELENAFILMKTYPSVLHVIADHFYPYIRKRGEELYENKDLIRDPKIFIPELIKLKKEMDSIVITCFSNDPKFQDTKNKAFNFFMNKSVYAKQLSNYTDYCMRNGFKGKSQVDVEKTLDEIVDLFKCLSNKLAFQIDSNARLSDRLIKNYSLSKNYETNFISKLKQEAGVSYVYKMTEMISDLEKNIEITELYKRQPSNGEPNGIKLNVQVISQSAWEINKKALEKIEMPLIFSSCLEDFENFYVSRHTSQKLKWCFGLSKIEIQYLYLNQKYVSISTLPQFLTLLQLEQYEKLSLRKISELLGCNIEIILVDIPGLIYNFSFNKQLQKNKGVILISENFDEKNKEFKESDEISINKSFQNNSRKFNTFPMTTKKNTQENKEFELGEAQIQKKYQDNILQATLTRIMKSRIGQITTHTWLITETAKQIDLFRAQPKDIKENIEKLIEKNYIKRSDDDRANYEYIA